MSLKGTSEMPRSKDSGCAPSVTQLATLFSIKADVVFAAVMGLLCVAIILTHTENMVDVSRMGQIIVLLSGPELYKSFTIKYLSGAGCTGSRGLVCDNVTNAKKSRQAACTRLTSSKELNRSATTGAQSPSYQVITCPGCIPDNHACPDT